ncbi:MAG: hypothetical protein LKE40_11335 [Spirochaetia bacterium]|jgi:Fe2+ transport system protein B|nr:hypothetical protein [Spirochaetia bacterium]
MELSLRAKASEKLLPYITKTFVLAAALIKPKEIKQLRRSIKFDKALADRCLVISLFICNMAFTFWLTSDVIGSSLSHLLAAGLGKLSTSSAG